MSTTIEEAIRTRFELFEPHLNERSRRAFAASEAKAYGRGGISVVSRMTGVSRRAIAQGIAELQERTPTSEAPTRIRKAGGGRKRLVEIDPTLWPDLDAMVEPVTRGDPMSLLRWSSKSLYKLAKALNEKGHNVTHQTVSQLLEEHGYSLQGNQKTREGGAHEDRDAKFQQINAKATEFMEAGQPVISVDTKKKELVGDFKNGGREYQPKGTPEQVRVHDFQDKDPDLGKVAPYGIYDLAQNAGWVNVGVDHDTAEFAVESIRQWWINMGQEAYPEATKILITADGGGSNGSRVHFWKTELQKLADATGLEISVCHFPPGTSKWNKIEHRMFSHITMNWRGRPLVTRETVVNLIGSTTTTKGLRIKAALDLNKYETGKKVSKEEIRNLNIERDTFHGEWNYTLSPRKPSN